jgi:hypothetical protein
MCERRSTSNAESCISPFTVTEKMGPRLLVFEVRKDGGAHHHAYSRLLAVGPFSNWDQARSFAVRIEWEHPLNSGRWMCRYLQAGRMFRFANAKIAGSLSNYANAISFLQWLFNASPNHSHNWIPRTPGSANVLQIFFNQHEQTITTKPPSEQLVMISGTLKPANIVVNQLKDPALGLENVGGEFGKFTGKMIGRPRKECDECTMLPDVAFDNGVFKKGCKRIGNSNLCQQMRLRVCGIVPRTAYQLKT